MEPASDPQYCHTARRTLEMLLSTLHFYFPETLRGRFERVSADFSSLPQEQWIDRAAARRDAITTAFRQLGEWSEMHDSSLLMSSWDDDVFFFYVLRTQFVFSRVAASPDALIPGTLEGFWQWGMTPQPADPWTAFPWLTARNLSTAPRRPPLWGIPAPSAVDL